MNGLIRNMVMRLSAGITIPAAQLFGGCATIGPQTVDRDRFDYVSAISESWKRLTLLNLLKIRYLDAPVFMDVASVINQYALETEIELGFTWQNSNTQSLGGLGTYSDRPTITYNPLMGEKFARGLLLPLPIPSVMLLVQSGYPADHVMQICVQSINGLKNRRRQSIVSHEADPEFYELLDLFRRVYEANGMAMRVRQVEETKRVVIFFRQPDNETDAENLHRVKQLLGLDPGCNEFLVVHGRFALNNQEIAILNRSMMQIMSDFASQIDVPQSDVSEGRVGVSNTETIKAEERSSLQFKVYNGTSKPDDAFEAVPYRDHWFWVGDRDILSKRMFNFLLTLFSFTERGKSEQVAPVITVPTN